MEGVVLNRSGVAPGVAEHGEVEIGAERPEGRLGGFLKRFEHGIVISLVVMMMVVVALSTLELGWIIIRDITTPPLLLLEVDELLEIFGFFLLILIGVELLGTLKVYLRDNVVHVEVVLEVALIAISRKVVVLDLAKYDGLTVLAIAALIVSLAAAFLFQRRARDRGVRSASGPPPVAHVDGAHSQ